MTQKSGTVASFKTMYTIFRVSKSCDNRAFPLSSKPTFFYYSRVYEETI